MDQMIDKELISRCCWQLLILASAALLVFPDTLASTHWLGQTWLWLTATPVCMLLVLHRHRFAAAWSTALVNSPSRRRRQTSTCANAARLLGRRALIYNCSNLTIKPIDSM